MRKKKEKPDSTRVAKKRKAEKNAQNIEGFGEELGLRGAAGGGASTGATPASQGPSELEGGDGEVSKRQSRKSVRQHNGILSIDDFRHWRYSCGVFKIQKEYEVMVHEAHANGRSIEAEMKAQGFKDYNAFARSCERFSLFCWPSELAELGSGFVLYFNLLAFLASLLAAVAVLQVPVMFYYSTFDSLDQWWWHSGGGAWSAAESCKCLGHNIGVFGPNPTFQNSSYGTACAAWDFAWCQNPAGPYSSPGRWCCRAWCFVSSSCSAAAVSSSPSMWDRHYRGMVRSVASCVQNDYKLSQQCIHLNDSAFEEAGVEESPPGNYISSSWLTPGNLGPNQGDEGFILLVYAIVTPVFHLMIAITRHHQAVTEDDVDSDTTSPNDFAVLVKGLPETATDEKSIEDFFRQHAVRGKMDTDIVKVVIGWDARDIRRRMKEVQGLRRQLESIPDQRSQQARGIQGRIKQISDDMAMHAGQQASQLKSSGVAVVVIRHQHDMRACLQRWTSTWARRFYADADDADWLPPNNGLKRGPPLPRFRMSDGTIWPQPLKVERAPNPGDINWMRLGVGKWERRHKLATTTFWMVVIVATSFCITLALNELQHNVKNGSKIRAGYQHYGFRALSILIGSCVSLINVLIRVFARYFGEEEFHDTHTDKEFSQALKMSVGMIINTSGVIFWLNYRPKTWYEKGGLVEDVFYVLVMDAIVAQFWMFLDLIYIGNYFERRKVTPEKLSDWNASIASHYPPKTAEDKEALQAVRAEIIKSKQMFEPDECDNPHRYACALNSFICCIIYTPVCPLLPFVGLAGIFCQYWVDKLLLLRWQKRPRPQNGNMARWSLKFLKTVAPVIVTSSVFVFVTPSWRDKSYSKTMFVVSTWLALAMILWPQRFWRTCCFCRGCSNDAFEVQDDDFEDYYHAQHMWPKEMKYHKDQFLYKVLPDDKNPEILEPGQDRTLNVDVMKGGFGTAVQHVVAVTAYGSLKTGSMRGAVASGNADRAWGCGWLHETGPVGYSVWSGTVVPPSPASYPAYNLHQPQPNWYGMPAGPGQCGTQQSIGHPVSHSSWGTAADQGVRPLRSSMAPVKKSMASHCGISPTPGGMAPPLGGMASSGGKADPPWHPVADPPTAHSHGGEGAGGQVYEWPARSRV